MLNLNQLKEREDLMAQQAKLGDELTFAEEHTLPWGFGDGTRTIPAWLHVRIMETTSDSPWWVRIFAVERYSNILAALRASGQSRQALSLTERTSRWQLAGRCRHHSTLW